MYSFAHTIVSLDVHRSNNAMLCTQESKAHFTVEVVEAFSILFGYSYYILTCIH